MNQVQIENGIIIFYGSKVGRLDDGCAVVDPMFKGQELTSFLERQRHINEVKWMDGMFDRLMSGKQDGAAAQELRNVRVWQLKPDMDVYMKFIGYEEMCKKFGPPDQENYQAVYDGAAENNDLEALYMKFGNDGSALPASYRGHSFSIWCGQGLSQRSSAGICSPMTAGVNGKPRQTWMKSAGLEEGVLG